MSRATSTGIAALLIAALFGTIAAQLWVLPSAVHRVAAVFPEVGPIVVPSIVWGVVAIACWQAVGIIGLRLVTLDRAGRLDVPTRGWLRAAIGCLALFFLLVAFAYAALTVLQWATPGVMLGLIAAGLVCVAAIVGLAVLLANAPNAVDAPSAPNAELPA
jgi:hypothetical protein